MRYFTNRRWGSRAPAGSGPI